MNESVRAQAENASPSLAAEEVATTPQVHVVTTPGETSYSPPHIRIRMIPAPTGGEFSGYMDIDRTVVSQYAIAVFVQRSLDNLWAGMPPVLPITPSGFWQMGWITPPGGQTLLRCAAALVSPTYPLPTPSTTLPAISSQVSDMAIVSANRLAFNANAVSRTGGSIAGQTYCLPSYSPYSVWLFYATSSQGWVPFNQLPVNASNGAWSLTSGLPPAIQYAAALIRTPYNVLPPSGNLPAVGGNVVALLISVPLFSFSVTTVPPKGGGTLSGTSRDVNISPTDHYRVAAFSLAADRSVLAYYTAPIQSDGTWRVDGMAAGAMYAAALVGQNFTYTPNPQYPKLPNPLLPTPTGRDVWEVEVHVASV
jgi:hypothetical protein